MEEILSREKIEDRIKYLRERLSGPYSLDIVQYNNFNNEKKELEKKLKQLPPELIERGTLTFEPHVSLVETESLGISLEQSSLGKWFSRQDGERGCKTTVVTDQNNIPIRIFRSFRNSDTLGKEEICAYNVQIPKLDTRVVQPIKEAPKLPPRCSQIEEGKGFMSGSQFDGSRYDLRWDGSLKVWRRPTTQEYDAQLKTKAELNKKENKQRRRKLKFL